MAYVDYMDLSAVQKRPLNLITHSLQNSINSLSPSDAYMHR